MNACSFRCLSCGSWDRARSSLRFRVEAVTGSSLSLTWNTVFISREETTYETVLLVVGDSDFCADGDHEPADGLALVHLDDLCRVVEHADPLVPDLLLVLESVLVPDEIVLESAAVVQPDALRRILGHPEQAVLIS